MAIYSFEGKTFDFPDDVTQEEALMFIEQQSGGGNAPTAQQPEPEPQSALDFVGETAATGGRILAGGVAGIANIGVGAINAIQSAGAWAGEKVGIGDGTYEPMPQAGYGSLDEYLKPQGTGEKLAAEAIPFILGGQVAAPLKAAEGASRSTRAATLLANQLPSSAAGSLAIHNQGDNTGALAADIAINTVAGAGLEKVGGAAINKIRNVLPESLGGFSAAEKAAQVVSPEFIARATQSGNQEAQQAFRTATTDAAGDSLLTPSQVFNTNQGARYLSAEQRDLARGTDSIYQSRLDAQRSGEGIKRAVEDAASPVNGEVSLLQQAAQDTTEAFKQRANQLYKESKDGAQQILNGSNVSQLRLPDTKNIAKSHLEDSATTGNIKLTGEARRTLKQFASDENKIKNIDDLDMWKRQLNEKAQKAYRAGDFTSYNALNDVKNALRNEADATITSLNSQAGSLYRDSDSFYSASIGDFGEKSVLGKIAGKENPDIAANALIRGQNAEFNTRQIVEALQDAINRGDIPNAQALANQLGQGLGDATRADALRAATTGENFSSTRFANTLSRLDPQAEAATRLGANSDQALINQALADAVRIQRDRVTIPQTNDLVAQLAGRVTGGGLGSLVGGPAGAVIGQEIGGRVTSSISKGLLDRISGTVKRGNEYIDYLSNPQNAQAVADVLAARGANLDNATAQEVKGIVDNMRRGVTGSLLTGDKPESQPQQESNPILPTLAQPQTRPEPEQQAQSIKVPKGAGSRKAINLYKSIASAETGNLDNRFIRTKAAESGASTAYGPAQITTTLAKDYLNNQSHLFNAKEINYLDRFITQGNRMLKSDDDDPVYGYGGVGVLGDKSDQRLYASVAIKMIDHMIEKNNGSLDKTVKRWRGNDADSAYFEKVRAAMQQERAK